MVEKQKGKYTKPMSFHAMVFWTGLFGGIFWGIIGYFAYFFNFTEVRPNVILEPLALGYWKNEWPGTFISIILFGVFSVIAAFIYYFALRTITGVWVGLAYGVVLFLVIFFVLNPLFPGIEPLTEMTRDTMITSICLFLVYGMFIGYSINYEYQNTKGKEKEAAS